MKNKIKIRRTMASVKLTLSCGHYIIYSSILTIPEFITMKCGNPKCIKRALRKQRNRDRISAILTQGRVSILLGTVAAIFMYLNQGLTPYVMSKVWLMSVGISAIVCCRFKKLPWGSGWHGLGGPVPMSRLNPYPVARIQRMGARWPIVRYLRGYPRNEFTKPRQLNGRHRRGC